MERHLAAILFADVVGFSTQMGKDELGTLTRLNAHRDEFINPTFAEHHGRVVKLMGDGVMVEFASVVDAVQCAVDIQHGMAERNIKAPEAQRILLRIGVNLGDVIVDEDDIYGDGVNIASRVQELAEPGGLCISGTVFEQVDSKLPHQFADLGERQLKGIAKPIRVYRARLSQTPAAAGPRPLFDSPGKKLVSITGGCLCGAVRFEIDQPPIDTNYCHCRMCQQFTGAPVVAATTFPRDAVRFTHGEPKYYKSSLIAERGFCGDCGSGLVYSPIVARWSDWLGIFTASLDNAADFAPAWHLGVESQMIPWLDLHDDLPRVPCKDSPGLVDAYESVGITLE